MLRCSRVGVVLGLFAAACSRPPVPTRGPTAPLVVETDVRPGLVQRVSLAPGRLGPGDTVLIASLVVNGSRDTVRVWSRMCSLALGGTLELMPVDKAVCRAESRLRILAPGDSVGGPAARRIVRSGPGRYTLWVGQLLQPEVGASVEVEIRPPAG